MNTDPPTRPRGHEYIAELERRYSVPAKQFLKESYEEHPLATTAIVIFAVTSFTPVVGAVALAAFTVCLAFCATLIIIIGLALGLATFLSTTLFSSLVLTFLVAGAIRLRSARRLGRSTSRRAAHTETPEATSAPSKRRRFPGIPGMRSGAFRRSLGFHRRGSWKARALLLFVLCDAVSRIRLPRVVRYSFLYLTLFGATLFGPRRTHFLQRGLSLPFALLRSAVWLLPSTGLKVARAPFRLFGWKAPLTIYLVLLLLSPRLRASTRGRIAHAAKRLGTATGRAAMVVLRSEQVAMVRELPWKAYVAAALEYAQAVLAVLIEFVRVQIEQLGEMPVEVPSARSAEETALSGSTETLVAPPEETAATPTQFQSEDTGSEYEMVPPVASGHGGDHDAVIPPMATLENSTETLRFRKVSAAMLDETLM
ncbi:hypothetical protein C8F04DRAFT_1202910 [Mycena alexandri]|uniref:Uncharacterized protein n=1 Tax=Mycena alexandri TaxID=1745969 RepID=A0AAD6WL11_9AGAR|nr:hypothetical protein C8F04DRAFT_1202910 [Mycena alexandri]